MSFLDDVAKVAKVIVKSPVTKVVAGGVAVVMPAIGVPALAGLAAADKVVDATDKGVAVVKAVAAGKNLPSIPGGRLPFAASLGQANFKGTLATQGAAAAKILANTAAQAKKGDAGAQRAMAAMKLVKAAKQGQPAAKAALLKEVKTQVANVLRVGSASNASPQDKQAARVVTALIKATAARKRASRKFGVNRQTARVVRVA